MQTPAQSAHEECPRIEKFQVAWLCALPVEAIAAIRMLDYNFGEKEDAERGDPNIYTLGRVKNHFLAIVQLPEYGIKSMASTIAHMVHSFPSLKIGILVGIGGGIPNFPENDIRLGDIVVSHPVGTSTGVIQYDMGKELLNGQFERVGSMNRPPNFLLSGVDRVHTGNFGRAGGPKFMDYFRHAMQPDAATDMEEFWAMFQRPDAASDRLFAHNCPNQEVDRPPRRSQVPTVHRGIILSGDKVVKDGETRERLRRDNEGALCFEMEAAGLMLDFPSLVIKGICDYSDSHKNKAWQGYASLVAAAYAKQLLHVLPVEAVSDQKLVTVVCEYFSERLDAVHQEVKSSRADMARIEHNQVEQSLRDKQDKCHRSFKTSDYEERKDLNPVPVKDTCQWVWHSDQFKHWGRSFSNDLLWISAEPGCGKSVLSKALVDSHLKTGCVCYFFFKDNEEQNSLATALCAVLHQLFSQQPSLLPHAIRPWSTNPSLPTDVGELWRILLSAMDDPAAKSTICVFDALDECSGHGRDQLLTRLKDFYSQTHASSKATTLKFFVTSRPYTEIQTNMRAVTDSFPHIHLNDEDHYDLIRAEIEKVVRCRMEELGKALMLTPEVQKRLICDLLKTENRTYLWVQLAIDYIRITFPRSFAPQKETIPAVPRSVNDAYTKILGRIEAKDAPRVRRIFQIIIAARRPLDTREMGMALGISGPGTHRTRDDAALDREEISSKIRQLCGLFVTIRGDIIYLLHQTAREFLLQDTQTEHGLSSFSFRLKEAEALWAKICVRYLTLDDDPAKEGTSTTHGALSKYSSQHWADHVQSMPLTFQAQMDGAIYGLYKARLKKWCHSFWEATTPRQHIPHPEIALHTAAFNGHCSVLRRLIESEPETVSQADDNGTTALVWSSWTGQCDASALLLSKGADPNAVSKLYGTPLLVAALKGRKNVVQLLLQKGADIDQHCGNKGYAQDHYARPSDQSYLGDHTGIALWAAALNGHCDIAQMLLERGSSEINLALMSACRGGHLDMIQLLLERGADLYWKDKDEYYGCAVQAAALGGHWDVLEFLFKHGAKDEVNHGRFNTAIQAATIFGHGRVMKLLLKYGHYTNDHLNEALGRSCHINDLQAVSALAPCVADVNACGCLLRQTIVQVAFERFSPEIIQVLFDNGADIHQWDPLASAARLGYTQIVQTLLGKGADVNRGNPLAEAAENGHLDAVRLLLDPENTDIDINQGYPLANAAENGHLDIVKLLLAPENAGRGTDIEHGYPLANAAENGHFDIVKLLLSPENAEERADVNRGNPLAKAAENGHFDVVKLLIKLGGGDVDINQESPLANAAGKGHLNVVKFLLDPKLAEKGPADINKGNPLARAAKNGHFDVVELLLGPENADIIEIDQGCPLTGATYSGHVQIVELLVNEGADPDAGLPLHAAALMGYHEIAQILLDAEASVYLINANNRTALEIARFFKHESVIECIMEARDRHIKSGV